MVQWHSDVPEAQPVLGTTTALSHVLKRCRAFVLMRISVLQLRKGVQPLFKETHTSFYGSQVWREALLQNPGGQVNQEG